MFWRGFMKVVSAAILMSELASQRKCQNVALVVGEDRVDRRVVEVDHRLVGIALVVLGDEVAERRGHRRAVALREDADALVDRLLGLDEGLLRIGLVVEADDLELLAVARRPWR